jgi:uncharacterized protein
MIDEIRNHQYRSTIILFLIGPNLVRTRLSVMSSCNIAVIRQIVAASCHEQNCYNARMALLIDGYNLLHVTNIVGHGNDLTALHRSREALLRFLAQSLEPAERKHTTIVFDAAGAPPGLPRRFVHEEITVHFAHDSGNADAMLEDLIAANDTPRSLIVVSSDHRVQRAARRRKAQPIDSDRWYAELWAARHRRNAPPLELPQKPTGELTPDEVAYWTRQFESPPAETTADSRQVQPRIDDEIANPFPPGYGEDLLEQSG